MCKGWTCQCQAMCNGLVFVPGLVSCASTHHARFGRATARQECTGVQAQNMPRSESSSDTKARRARADQLCKGSVVMQRPKGCARAKRARLASHAKARCSCKL